ncbi:hypothetical protein O0L34_g14265 [Tuta absoluta]|nr:hypothetical protein O0L34_g14265 [Tuta absoluta]
MKAAAVNLVEVMLGTKSGNTPFYQHKVQLAGTSTNVKDSIFNCSTRLPSPVHPAEEQLAAGPLPAAQAQEQVAHSTVSTSSSGTQQKKHVHDASTTNEGKGKGKEKGKGKCGTQCVLFGTFFTSRNMVRHFKIKHPSYLGGKIKDQPEYPRLFYFKTILQRTICPPEFHHSSRGGE